MVAVVAAPSAAHAQKSPTAQAAVARAYQDLAANKLAEAVAEMEIAVRFEPRFALGWYLLGSISRRTGDLDRAAAGYRRYIELRPAEPDPYFGLGLCLDAIGDRAGALAALRHYAESDPRASSAQFVAEAHTRIAKLERGGGSGKIATAAADRNAQAATLLAARKFGEAAQLLRASIESAPADAASWYKLGFALRQAGQPIEAAKAYRRSITLQPGDLEAYYGLGQVLVAANHPDEALAAFRTYVKAGPDKTDARWIAKARKEISRLQDATRAPSQAGALPPAASSRSGAPSTSLAAASAAPPSEPTPAGASPTSPQGTAPVQARE